MLQLDLRKSLSVGGSISRRQTGQISQSCWKPKCLIIEPTPESNDAFTTFLKRCSRMSIPCGCRTLYIPGFTSYQATLFTLYENLLEDNPWGEATVEAGNQLILSIREFRRHQWIRTAENLDLTRNSHEAWRLLRRLNNNPTKANKYYNITANQIAHQLLLNGKTINKGKRPKLQNEGQEVKWPYNIQHAGIDKAVKQTRLTTSA